MTKIDVSMIQSNIAEMCVEANYRLPSDVLMALQKSEEEESSPIGKDILKDLITNASLAKEKDIPMCQDTGMAVLFIEIGQNVQLVGGDVNEAINEGVRQGYQKGYLRKSVVSDPLERINTKDNTPAIIHYQIVPGDELKIALAPKGFGSENMSQSKMLKPSDGVKGVEEFILKVVSEAGPNPCPPIVVGVGIGGTIEKAAILAKKALTRDIGTENPKQFYADLEKKMLRGVNDLGIGPQGLGGNTTALAVHIEEFPTHIAGLPVVVNINCHATRHVARVIGGNDENRN